MKINHHLLRNILRAAGIAIFIISVTLKIKQIVLYGGTKNIKNPNDDIDEPLPEADYEIEELVDCEETESD